MTRCSAPLRAFLLAALALLAAGCQALLPGEAGLERRLAAFGGVTAPLAAPVAAPVEILWDAHQIPYVIAATDRDAAFALGMIQAHLRGGELALARHLVRGRLSELGGPGLNDIDHALRILDFGRAADAAIARMPPETRAWLEAFVDGINWFEATHGLAFPEAGLLGLEVEPYSAADMIAIGRLGGQDVNWPLYRDLAALWGTPAFERAFARIAEAGSDGMRETAPAHARLEALAALFGRTGSNAWAVAPSRSASGGAMLAADPHLSLSLPGVWIAAGVRAPGMKAVGLMPLGVPVLAIGRSADMAWAGTNLHAAVSDLYDVSGLPAEAIASTPTRIRTRFWFDTLRTVRMAPQGPVISDAAELELPGRMLALRWAGHLPTDEISALLGVARARTPEEFRAALESFGQPPQTMVFAAADGHIGAVLATTQPDRAGFTAAAFIKDGTKPDPDWDRLLTASRLPVTLDPPGGVLVSANQNPEADGAALGFTFAGTARARRIAERLNHAQILTLDDLARAQRDTLSREAAALARHLAREIRSLGLARTAPAVLARLEAWNGDYAAGSTGAPAFEALLYWLLPPLHGAAGADDLDPIEAEWEVIVHFLPGDLAALTPEARRDLLRDALRHAERDIERTPTWGDMHRMPVAHILSAVPVIGGFFDYGSYPAGGSRQTAAKAAHGLLRRRTAADFGASARFLADLADPDENWVVLFGGQDGWLGSSTARDQIALWRAGAYIRLPMSDAAIRAAFRHRTTLVPEAAR